VSDFLTNLAARTIATPSLRPRSRMRFEPAAAEPPAIAPDVARDEAPAAPTPPALPRGKPPVRQPAAFATRTESEPPAPPVPPMQAEVVAPPQYAAPPATADPSDEPQIIREPARPPRIINVPTTALERIVELPEQAAETIVERVTETRAVPSIKRITINAETPAERPHRYDEQAPRIEPVAPAHEEERSETAPDRRAPAQRATTARPRTAFFPMPAESTPAAPEREAVVQVSIGRIEVRAVRPAAPQRTAERANPIMTIEEYMSRRKGRP
jgi:hypothetical protein